LPWFGLTYNLCPMIPVKGKPNKLTGAVFLLAIYFLAPILIIGAPSKSRPAEGISELKRKADTGDAKAQYEYGSFCAIGFEVRQDWREAVRYFEMAANSGLATAQYKLGVCHENGLGTSKDPEKAIAWYKKAASQNLPMAYYRAAKLLCKIGRGYREESAYVKDAYHKAACMGVVEAQLALSELHYPICRVGCNDRIQCALEAYRWALASQDAFTEAAERAKDLKEKTLFNLIRNEEQRNKKTAEIELWVREFKQTNQPSRLD